MMAYWISITDPMFLPIETYQKKTKFVKNNPRGSSLLQRDPSSLVYIYLRETLVR